MSVTTSQPQIGLASRLVNGILAIDPLANFAKARARKMMIQRAESIGVPWRENVRQLSLLDWDAELSAVKNPNLEYPEYYTTSFHAYDEGNLSWQAAWEVESASRAVHAQIWAKDKGKNKGDVRGDFMLRDSYNQVIKQQLKITPQTILDLGCGAGMSTFALQSIYPQARLTGVDLSPYFLAVARYRAREQQPNINWVHAAAENTTLPDNSFDLVSACLVFHELPTKAATAIINEAHRLLRPGGYLAIMDMNPNSETFVKMPPYILTLLKSTEPYLDRYFALDLKSTFVDAGFTVPSITTNSPRHRSLVGQKN